MLESDPRLTVSVLIGAAALMTISGSALPTTDSAEIGARTTDDTTVGSTSAEPELEYVVVTARRRTERAQDVPIPIATVAGGDLAGFNQTRQARP